MTNAERIQTSQYRPHNVTVEAKPADRLYSKPTFVVLDFDGTPLRRFDSQYEADAYRNKRAGVIKAALKRRANKAAK